MAPDLKTDGNKTGALIIAHGDRHDEWNQGVRAAIAPLRQRYILELAFLYPVPGESLQDGLDRLESQGVETVLAIPLLISSYSEHFEELEYVLGLRDTVSFPTEAHGRVAVKARIRLGGAIDGSPTVTRILERRARKLVRNPQRETLVLVGHGPNSEEDNHHWLRNMDRMAEPIRKQLGLRKTHCLTLRDDAPTEVRDAASRTLRRVVQEESKEGDVLVLPLLVSHGEVQAGIEKRLEGLSYRLADEGLVADPLIACWIEEEIQRLTSSNSL